MSSERKHDVWRSEIRVKEKNATRALRKLVELVKRHESVH